MQLIDTHCHLDYDPLANDVQQWLTLGKEVGIERVVVPATTAERFEHLARFVESDSRLLSAFGLHPIYLAQHDETALSKTEEFIARAKPIAVGEVGLDYFVETLDREAQQHLFERMIELAQQHKLPLILHVRRSHDAVIATLRRHKFQEGGIVHAFAGSMEQAKAFIKLGFVLGFGGVMTYSSATRVRRLAQALSLSDIVLETDAPDMKPADWPLSYNTPLALLQNFTALCQLRTETPDEIAAATTSNACRALRFAI